MTELSLVKSFNPWSESLASTMLSIALSTIPLLY